jgi:putative ABC transport system substrate-binding protein
MGIHIRRREMIVALGGATMWPRMLQAQHAGGMRRIGVLMAIAADDPESQIRLAAFAQALQQLGWVVGQNVVIDYRWGAGNAENLKKFSAELVALSPDIIMANSSAAVSHILNATRAIPVVFTTVTDPVGAGYVESLAHPGGNITGFTNFEYAIAGKWLELLKEIAPQIRRVAVMRESAVAAGPGQFAAIQAAAAPLGCGRSTRVTPLRSNMRLRHLRTSQMAV